MSKVLVLRHEMTRMNEPVLMSSKNGYLARSCAHDTTNRLLIFHALVYYRALGLEKNAMSSDLLEGERHKWPRRMRMGMGIRLACIGLVWAGLVWAGLDFTGVGDWTEFDEAPLALIVIVCD